VKRFFILTILLSVMVFPALADAQEKEFELNGYVQLQGGIFAPLTSNLFQDYDSTAYYHNSLGETDISCDPVNTPNKPCYPHSHGARAGKPSMLRGTLQLMAEWRPEERILIHAVVRGVYSLKLDFDDYAQIPYFPEGEDRRTYAKNYVWNNYYTEVDLREFYVDIEATNWLSFRLGRQQVVWGDINSYRLLDVINPIDNTWHFGPLESFEDTRFPLWIAKAMFEMKSIDHSLELLWVPGFDRDHETVNVPLTFVGTWGLPLSDTPSPFVIDKKEFMYPGNAFEDMRAGLRWRGHISPQSTYSLIYYYTHMMSPPIPLYFDLKPKLNAEGKEDASLGYDSDHMEKLFLGFPRQHIAGFAIDYAFESPIGLVAKLEASVEPDRTFPTKSTMDYTDQDPNLPQRYHFKVKKMPVINYAVQLIRPTMIRWLNPTQNIILVLQGSHSVMPTITDTDESYLLQIPGFNNYPIKMHSWKLVFLAATSYLHGMIAPRLVVAYVDPKSAFISGQVDFRLGRHWRLRLQVTDFFGSDQYKALGLFRDRDEVNVRIRYQF